LEILVLLVSIAAGSVAAIAGFGIGSLITPVFALHYPLKVAVAAVAIPHIAATATRLWLMREHVDRKLFIRFGLASAVGGLIGAFLYSAAGNPVLTAIFGAALVLTATLELTGAARRVKLKGPWAWIAGTASGLLGGMVGNQGGIRSAALLGFETTRQSFVATATAVALLVDLARLPVYVSGQYETLMRMAGVIGWATAGALIGTFIGKRVLDVIPERVFRPAVSLLILALGTYMLWVGIRGMF
jgi:uncharacterized membrane protein YfcA